MNLEQLFFKLLSFRSITPSDGGAFDFIKSYMQGWDFVDVNVEDTKNLIIYKKFGDGIHLSFAGHIDVVPADKGWDSDPFIPTKKDGFIYARGTQDMKSGVCAFLSACRDIREFNGTISMLLTSDEEGEGTYGSIKILEYLKKENFLPDAVVVAEPTCDKIFGDSIKVGRRGSINGVLEIFGRGGHAAYPEKSKNTIHEIAPLLDKLAGHLFDDGDEFFAPSQLVLTDIRSGLEVTNVTPGYLKLMFNVRNSTKTKKEDVETYIKELLKECEFKLKLTQGSFPFITDKNSLLIKNMTKSVEKILHLKPDHSTAGGTSDARHMGSFGIDVVEFGVINDRIHAPNERVDFSEVEGLERVFRELIKLYSKD
ncbi:MAG: succinyl-diaminopimelate desuccinylase [Proteobacteria bacterium]|nr:MAG: succinyl-diaminopimelate desuccinylase [Pseudomonadota bacterium]